MTTSATSQRCCYVFLGWVAHPAIVEMRVFRSRVHRELRDEYSIQG